MEVIAGYSQSNDFFNNTKYEKQCCVSQIFIVEDLTMLQYKIVQWLVSWNGLSFMMG